MSATTRARIASAIVVTTVVAFWALEVPAMMLYPGGTWWDATTRGARFWQNYLCDLEWSVALDGLPNELGARFGTAAMGVADLGMLPFWWLLASQLAPPRRGAARAIRALGTVSVAGTVGVAAFPSDHFPVMHAASVICAGIPGLSAALVAVVALARAGRRGLVGALLGGAMLVAALLDFLLYTAHVVAGTGGPPLVAAAQKGALLLLQAWMLATAVSASRRSRDIATA